MMCPYKRKKRRLGTQRHREGGQYRDRQILELYCHKTRKARSHWELEGAGGNTPEDRPQRLKWSREAERPHRRAGQGRLGAGD